MPYFLITDEQGAGLRVDFAALIDHVVLDDGQAAQELPSNVTPHEALHAARPLAELKAKRWAQLKAERDAREFGTFTWDGSTFDCDPRSQARLQGAVTRAERALATGTPFVIDWTLADNSARTMGAADLIAAGDALLAHVATLHATGRALREAVFSATSAAEISAVVWPT